MVLFVKVPLNVFLDAPCNWQILFDKVKRTASLITSKSQERCLNLEFSVKNELLCKS